MSEASQSAHVIIVLADYAVADQQGKMTLVGAGVSIFGINPNTGTTAPFAVWVNVTFPPSAVGDIPAVELALETDDGRLFEVPGATDEQGQPQTLRVKSSETLRPTVLPGTDLPLGVVRPKAQIVLQFQTGLPLAADQTYRWRVKVDNETRDEWTELMHTTYVGEGHLIVEARATGTGVVSEQGTRPPS
jgi:hypothetical protein